MAPKMQKGLKFDGVSSFMLWGGVVLNVDGYSTALELVQALAHESGHNLLFGPLRNGPLQNNDDNERYPRHCGATCGRWMASCMRPTSPRACINRFSGCSTRACSRNSKVRKRNRPMTSTSRHFASGMETVDRYARLTSLGQAVMAGAQNYMRGYP